MFRKALVFAAAVACAAMDASAFSVADVQPKQRFPWNGKVDVEFTLESERAEQEYVVSVNFRDEVGGTNLNANTFRYSDEGVAQKEFVLRAGRHKITWDADADAPEQAYTNIYVTVDAKMENPLDAAEYVVIDVSGGSSATNYPVTTLDSVPSGGWTDEYKTTKIVLRRCPKGADPLGRYTLTQDFYAGVFEITRKQWELVMGAAPSFFNGDMRPVEQVSYNMIRGDGLGAQWSASAAVDATSFIGKLRSKSGLDTLDLPTEAQWEYACRAGTTTKYCAGDEVDDLASVGWYSANSSSTMHSVGQKTPNAWGLYDMHGNAWEWCLDWYGKSMSGADPAGAASGSNRLICGGSFEWTAYYVTSSSRYQGAPSYAYRDIGFRLFKNFSGFAVESGGCGGMTLVTSSLPELGAEAVAEEVAAALADAADAKLKANVKTAEEYAAFRGWAAGLSSAGAKEVKESAFAWLSYALDQSGLLTAAPEAVKVDAIDAVGDGSFEIAVEMDGVAVGDGAQAGNLAKLVGVEGAAELTGQFSSGNVTAEVLGAEGGKVKVRFAPKDATARSFFLRAVLTP